MKTIFRLLCGWMAIALAACTGDELQQIEPLQKPVAQKTISVKAYTPSEQAATRLAFEDKGEDGLKLSWTADDAFTALINNSKVTFTYDEDSKEFTANVNESVTLTDGLKAYYLAYDGENFEMDFSRQTGQLNGATTYMEGVYSNGAFRFTHSTAILKATFSSLPQDATISSIQISGAVDITIANYNSSAAAYINLPAIPKDGQLKFMVETATGDVYTATKTVRAVEGIKTGVYYNTTVELQKACLLPTGGEFKSAVETFLQSNSSLTKIKFVANSDAATTKSDANDENATEDYSYRLVAGSDNTLEIHTSAAGFLFNEDCNHMFSSLSAITAINFNDCINTSNVSDMSYMFYDCKSLSSLNVGNFNTAKVTNMAYMFYDCKSLSSLNVGNFNTAKVTDMKYMFNNCSSLTSLNLSNFNTSKVTNMGSMFRGCSSLESLDLSSFNTAKVTKMDGMFSYCKKLTSLDLNNFNTEKVKTMDDMFNSCKTLTSLDLSSFNTANVEHMSNMFNSCSSLTSLNVSSFNTANVTSMYYMFNECSALTSLDLSNFNTANVTSMANMFNICSSLTSLNVSSFNTAKVENMAYMFCYCSNIAELKLINFDFGNVIDFDDMFYCLASNNTDTDPDPVPVYVTQDSYDILKYESTGINSPYACFVDENGNTFGD